MFGPSPRSLCLAPPPGHIVFAIGFADADYGELVSIASAPSERHVFFVDDLDAFQKIEEKLVTFVCEAASASELPSFLPPSLPPFLHPSSLADQIILKPVFTGACQAWCWAGNNLNQVNVNQVNANRVNVNPVSVYLVNVV